MGAFGISAQYLRSRLRRRSRSRCIFHRSRHWMFSTES
jgi:hypothetical protein